MLILIFQISLRPYAPGQGQHRETARDPSGCGLSDHRAIARTQNNFSAVVTVAPGTAAARKQQSRRMMGQWRMQMIQKKKPFTVQDSP